MYTDKIYTDIVVNFCLFTVGYLEKLLEFIRQ